MQTKWWRRQSNFEWYGLDDNKAAVKVNGGRTNYWPRQRGAGIVEYLLITGFLVAALMVPFGSENKNAIQQLMDAIRDQHAAYNYSAKLPALPNLDGDDSIVPDQSGGSGGGNDSSGSSGTGSDAGGDADDSGAGAGNDGDADPDSGLDGGSNGNQDDSGQGGGGGSIGGPPGGDASDLGGIIDNLPPDAPWEEVVTLRQLANTLGVTVSQKIGAAELAALAFAACMLSEDENPYWTADDIAAYEASNTAYKEKGEKDWDRYDKDLAGFEEHGIEFPVNKDAMREKFYNATKDSYDTDEEREAAFKEYFLNELDGFAATLTPRGDGTFVLAFRGSEFHELNDWVNNKNQALHGSAVQYDYAQQLAKAVQDKLGDKVLLAGHSLGGGLAAAASYKTGWKAITFNAAGVHPNYKAAGQAGPITNHYVKGEVLTTLQKYSFDQLPQASGVQVGHSGSCNPLTGNPLSRHKLGSFKPPSSPGWERPDEKEPGVVPEYDEHGRVVDES